ARFLHLREPRAAAIPSTADRATPHFTRNKDHCSVFGPFSDKRRGARRRTTSTGAQTMHRRNEMRRLGVFFFALVASTSVLIGASADRALAVSIQPVANHSTAGAVSLI